MQIWCHDGDFALSCLSTEFRHLRELSSTPDDAYVSLALIAALFEIQPKPPHGNGARYYATRKHAFLLIQFYDNGKRKYDRALNSNGQYCSVKIMYFWKIRLCVFGKTSSCVLIKYIGSPVSQSFVNTVSTVSLLINSYYSLYHIYYINLIF